MDGVGFVVGGERGVGDELPRSDELVAEGWHGLLLSNEKWSEPVGLRWLC